MMNAVTHVPEFVPPSTLNLPATVLSSSEGGRPSIVDQFPSAQVDETVVANAAEMPCNTDETDKTELSVVTNDDFLKVVFGSNVTSERPIVCNLFGSPQYPVSGSWNGTPWIPGETITDSADQNWYFSLATFRPDTDGTYRRRKTQFEALHAIMLDDIGTKAAERSRLDVLPPSWLIETSPGNFQAGYMLSSPLTDGALAEKLVKAIIAEGLCDRGADGPLARYARLPCAVNGKHMPHFPCRLVEWRPERRFTIDELVERFGLKLATSGAAGVDHPAHSREHAAHHGGVYLPRASENPVIVALRARGLYREAGGSGKHVITCPWVNEHTDAVDSGTAYFEPNETTPVGGFKCLHGHCADRHIGDLLDYLEIGRVEAKHRAVIRAVEGELSHIVDAAERELAATGKFYQRAGQIVNIFSDPSTAETGIRPVNSAALLKALSGAVHWERFDQRSKSFRPVDPPAKYLSVLSDTQSQRHLPLLKGLARQPYLRPDGTIMAKSGYDRCTGMFGEFDEASFDVPDNPTREDAVLALSTLEELLQEFSFASEIDRAAALSAILTAAIRPSLPQAPMFHVKAPQISSGKSYLTNLIASFASPSPTPATAFPSNEEECQKLLLSKLIEAPAVLCFDNLTTDLLPHKSLCSSLTDEFVSGRLLGASKTATVGTRVLFLSSGNNVDPIRDMARRCVTIRLDPGCETPAARSFSRRPVEEVQRDRGRYVSLALTIVRAWIVSGMPPKTCRPIASYTKWSDIVRQALLWLDRADPAESIFTAMAVDPNSETLGRLLSTWSRVFAKKPTMVRDVVETASRHSSNPDCVELHEVISDIADERGQISRKRLGRWIMRNEGRIVGGLRFVKAPTTRNSVQWQIESVTSISSVSGAPPREPVTGSVGGAVTLH